MRADAKNAKHADADSTAPAVIIHGLAQARWALSKAGPAGVLLLSAPGAAGYAGAAWFLAVVTRARQDFAHARCGAALDCGDAPGLALGAIRAGVRTVILDPSCPAFAAVAAAAEEARAALWDAAPEALDIGGLDPKRRADQARLAAWLSAIGSPRAPGMCDPG